MFCGRTLDIRKTKKEPAGDPPALAGSVEGVYRSPFLTLLTGVTPGSGESFPPRLGFQRRPPRRELPRELPRVLPREPDERVFPADFFGDELRLLESALVLPPRGEGRGVDLRALDEGRGVDSRALGDGRFGERWTDVVRRRSGVDGRAAGRRTWELERTSGRELELELRGRALRSPPLLGFGCERAPVLRVLPEGLGRARGFDDGDVADEPDFVEPLDAAGRSRV